MSQHPSPNSDNGTPTNSTAMHFSKLSPISTSPVGVVAPRNTGILLNKNSQGGKHLGGKTRIANKKKKSKLTFDELEMSSEEDEENITVEVVNKIIFDYFSEVLYWTLAFFVFAHCKFWSRLVTKKQETS